MDPARGESPERDALLAELFYQVRAEQEDVQAFDEVAARILGINLTDLRVLGILDRNGRLTASQLAEEASLTTGSTTTLVDRLERAGFARRTRDTEDRRRVFVHLTDQARERMEGIWGPIGAEAAQITGRYSDEELTLLIDYLKRGRDLLKRHRERLECMEADRGPRREPNGA